MPIFDTHAHYDAEQFASDREAVLSALPAAGVGLVVDPGCDVASSREAGVYAVKTDQGRQVFLMGHAEYDRDTLRREYMRDLAAGVDIQIPQHYFPGDDPSRKPRMNWRSCAHLLYANWLNYCVYQTAPYDIRDIERGIRTDS